MINKLKIKLKQSKGETLVETLAAILIGTLAVSLLVSAVMFAANLNKKTYEADNKFYEGLNSAEQKNAPVSASGDSVKIEEGTSRDIEVEVSLYGIDGTVYSYSLKDGTLGTLGTDGTEGTEGEE